MTDDGAARLPGKRSRPGRTAERAAIRAVMAVFENTGMLVQEVDTVNDIGKDLYVDLAQDGRFTGELIALQVKGGRSYRGANGSHRLRASADDRDLWANSSIPVFGVIHDPNRDALYWTNLTSWSRAHLAQPGDLTATMSSLSLTSKSLPGFLDEARAFLSASGLPALLGLADDDEQQQIRAVHDAFALGRHDPRPLLLIRRSLMALSDPALVEAVRTLTLALVVSHGDIYWHAGNWIDDRVRARVSQELADWTLPEATRLLALPEPEEWSRGGLGQDVAALIGSGWGPDVERLLETVARMQPFAAAWPALTLLVSAAGENGPETFAEIVPRSPALRSSELVAELGSVLHEHGSAYLW